MALDIEKAVTVRIIELLEPRTEPWSRSIGGGEGKQAVEQSDAYIEGWRKKLAGGEKLVVHAAPSGRT